MKERDGVLVLRKIGNEIKETYLCEPPKESELAV
jgi:hypothetical protein